MLLVALCAGPLTAQPGPPVRKDARAGLTADPESLATVPVELHAAHVYVRARADSAAPAWFILDTGASTTLDSAYAASVAPTSARTERGGGGGEQPVQVRFVERVSLALADAEGEGARVPPARIAVVSLGAISRSEGRSVAGILGGSFFTRYAVVIDYARAEVRVYNRGAFHPPPSWRALPLQREGDLVFARAAVTLAPDARPEPGWYEIDTGGGHALILNAPLVARHGLAGTETGAADAMLSIGGGATAVRGRVPTLRLGETTFTDVPALLSRATEGLFASPDFDGSIGGGLLERFAAVAFDYASKRLWIAPRRSAR